MMQRPPLRVSARASRVSHYAHLLKRVVNPPGSNPGQRRDRLLDPLGRDPAQTYAIVRAWLYL